MAGRKGSRSSKTDHVLNLLSGGAKKEETPAAPEQEKRVREETAGGQPPQVEQQPAPAEGGLARRNGERLGPPILQVARTNNEALSQTIRDALTQTLEEELAQGGGAGPSEAGPEPQPEPQPEQAGPESEQEPESEPGGTPAQEAEPEAAPEAAEEEAPAPPGQPGEEGKAEPAGPFLPRETRLPDSAVCVNVMELLVDERLDRYVRMFGLCTCPRCLADVRALSLTRLPPKYVVLPGAYAAPMISLYRAKFESQVIAQVIQACKTVMEHPRHGA
ncbi:late competence development ComFB family protein [uncultured Pseudoflavonifractor sp.]|uniref:late competence development ComFB family protein n=1 Tax=uncultured Pseudoflavonifractor sp. TaxID=1221379 RepID=UPI0025D31F36|nr:late competence development ComFB family protein [uncultured Pseudoflavonifractor sp.]